MVLSRSAEAILFPGVFSKHCFPFNLSRTPRYDGSHQCQMADDEDHRKVDRGSLRDFQEAKVTDDSVGRVALVSNFGGHSQ